MFNRLLYLQLLITNGKKNFYLTDNKFFNNKCIYILITITNRNWPKYELFNYYNQLLIYNFYFQFYYFINYYSGQNGNLIN